MVYPKKINQIVHSADFDFNESQPMIQPSRVYAENV